MHRAPRLGRTAWVALVAAACAARPSGLPVGEPFLIAVKSVRLPERSWLPWYTRFAEHAWIDVKDADGWHRIEWNSRVDQIGVDPLEADEAVDDERWERPVAVHSVRTGEGTRELAARLLALAPGFADVANYRAWPGPNSNTFVEWLAQAAGLRTQLPPNAVGKDYTPWLRAGVSSTGLGLELETIVLGAQVGFVEGVELHLLGLTFGVGIWPPQLKLPFVPAIPGGWIWP